MCVCVHVCVCVVSFPQILSICLPAAEKVKEKYSEPRECGMIQGECGELLMGWTLGMTGVCYDVPAGIRFGKTRFSSFIFEVS